MGNGAYLINGGLYEGAIALALAATFTLFLAIFSLVNPVLSKIVDKKSIVNLIRASYLFKIAAVALVNKKYTACNFAYRSAKALLIGVARND